MSSVRNGKIGRSLQSLNSFQIPRSYFPLSVDNTLWKVHIYGDASEKAISAVAYLKVEQQNVLVGFVLGKSKVAPKHEHTIPRY